MDKHNQIENNKKERRLSSCFLASGMMLALLATMVMATASAYTPASAFASSGNVNISDQDNVDQANVQSSEQTAVINSDNTIKGSDGGSVSNNISQSSDQSAVNIFQDNDKLKLPKSYSGSFLLSDNDKVDQNNIQISKQNALIDSDNKLYGAQASSTGNEGSSVDNSIVQNSKQTALNAFFDNDKIHVQKGYNGDIAICDDDRVNQTNLQSSDQNAIIKSDNKIKEAGDGSNPSVNNAIEQHSNQKAANIFKDNDKIMVKKSYEGDVMLCDNDMVNQTNAQLSDQGAAILSDNKLKGDKDAGSKASVNNAIEQSSNQGAANILADNDFYKFK
jgi:hypothetical protein